MLAILDGWGHREEVEHNSIRSAETPIMDALWHAYPHTLIEASGCLLYTSPSPRDGLLSRMPSSA